MIYLVIPVFNRVESTRRCLKSVYSLNRTDLKVFVVDDGSTDGSPESLAETYPEVTIIPGSGNLFWTGAVSLGITHAMEQSQTGDWLILANNDVIFSRGTIEILHRIAIDKNRKAIISALSIDLVDRDTIIKTGTVVRSWVLNITHHILAGKKYSKLSEKSLISADLLTGRCLIHPIEIFNEIGNYNAKDFPHYGGDDEFTARAKRMGFELFVAPSSIVYLDTGTTGDKSNFWTTGLSSIKNRFFGIRSNINIITKWRFAKAVVPAYAIPSYYLVAVLKSVYVYISSK